MNQKSERIQMDQDAVEEDRVRRNTWKQGFRHNLAESRAKKKKKMFLYFSLRDFKPP